MTIDEAIAKYKQITNTDANCPIHCMRSCDKCAQESGQLVEWLEELKEYKENQHRSLRHMYEKGYNKAIDDFVRFANAIQKNFAEFVQQMIQSRL